MGENASKFLVLCIAIEGLFLIPRTLTPRPPLPPAHEHRGKERESWGARLEGHRDEFFRVTVNLERAGNVPAR